MTQNASITPAGDGQYTVTVYKKVHCPACDRILFESQKPPALKIICSRCQGMWKMEGDKAVMLRPPKHVAGKMLLNGVEKFYK